jgi:ribosomal-protein-alanine N-acetyltransferase
MDLVNSQKNFLLRHASGSDQNALLALLSREEAHHRHLDWRSPVDWLGFQPFWILGKENSIVAALACPVDPPGISWVRLFICGGHLRPLQTWNLLFEKARGDFSPGSPPVIASLALYKWYSDILKESGFSYHHDIVVLFWNARLIPGAAENKDLRIRLMTAQDLDAVSQMDNIAFTPLWRNSLATVTRSFMQSTYSTVAVLPDGKIAGYQISSHTPLNAHLARLAVEPGLQQRGIGALLVSDLLKYYAILGIPQITVNTQSNNHSSLSLYKKLGFEYTGESFPVYLYSGSPV